MSSAQFCPLSKLDKLILATDRSPFSKGAEQEAINLAKKCSSHLNVVSVLESNPEYETIGSAYFESFKEKASQEGINCKAFLLQGESPFRLIVDEAAEKKVDMIIIGRHGRT